ncbi:MAG: alpha/beta hydrolase [Planctomycetota bacterium]|nr:alpha/beta hydrolase [Planctomycetota bacterium]
MDELTRLLGELEAAVKAGDRARAHDVAGKIEGLILRNIEQERAKTEESYRRSLAKVVELLAIVDRPAPARRRATDDRTLAGPNTARAMAAGEERSGRVFPVWFGTNREPLGDGFGNKRAGKTTLGVAEVYVPEAHRFGEVGTSWWTKLRRLDLRDDTLRVQRIHSLDVAAFFAQVDAAVKAARNPDGPPQALVFIHGFNVSFEEAAVRAAQLGVDLDVSGATAFFSWPSRGSVAAYTADEATIDASERAIADFLTDFGRRCGAERVDVIAHSMGNRGLLRSLQRIAADAERRSKVKFGQIILAAPDVDRDLFLDLAHLYPEFCDRCTLYASNRDVAVHASSWVHWGHRAGYFQPYTVTAGVDTIAVPNFNVDLLGHGYFAAAERLLHDMFTILRHASPPGRRQGIEAMPLDNGGAWRLRR